MDGKRTKFQRVRSAFLAAWRRKATMSEAKVYRCPCCGSVLTWDGRSGEMKCGSCSNTFPLETLEQYDLDQNIRDTRAEDFQWSRPAEGTVDGDDGELRAYTCSSCGAQMVVSDTAAAACCPYCGNDSVIPQALQGKYRPQAVIPFLVTREEAVDAYKDLCKRKRLVPRKFIRDSRIEKMQGIYVPFWLFDCETDSDVTYKATRTSTTREGKYMVTRTRHYSVRRGGTVSFADVPVNSSTKLDDTLMEAVEPYDVSSLEKFNTAYLSGFQAERYDQGVDKCMPRAAQRIRESVSRVFRSTVTGYSTVVPVNTQVNLTHSTSRYVMMPVWILNSTWRGKTYTFAMNGQNGRVRGGLPVGKGRVAAASLGLFTLLALAGAAIVYFLF